MSAETDKNWYVTVSTTSIDEPGDDDVDLRGFGGYTYDEEDRICNELLGLLWSMTLATPLITERAQRDAQEHTNAQHTTT